MFRREAFFENKYATTTTLFLLLSTIPYLRLGIDGSTNTSLSLLTFSKYILASLRVSFLLRSQHDDFLITLEPLRLTPPGG
jgi:hypothetical protein